MASKYDPNERTALQSSSTQKRKPRLRISDDGRIDLDHPDPSVGFDLLKASVGTTDNDFTGGLLEQLSHVGSGGDEQSLNFALSMIQGVEPTDQIEAMLATQMAAVHNATMTFAKRLNQADNVAQQDSAARAFNNLAKTFTSQIDALKRYRTGGQQNIVVQHVNVADGGQAIVGNVHGGGGYQKFWSQPLERTLSLPNVTTMHRHVEADPQTLSGSGRSWMDCMPVSRCARRRTERQAERCI